MKSVVIKERPEGASISAIIEETVNKTHWSHLKIEKLTHYEGRATKALKFTFYTK